MRIAQVAPLAESVPPKLYGGTERVVAWLVDELVNLGHEVTLFASGDSVTGADLIPVCPRALRLGPALLFPIDWPEPFGLVMIEAMACGTPVIAYRSGSVPEVVDHGITGFVVSGEEEAIQAIGRLGELDRRRIRAQFEKRFTSRRMADEYLNHYAGLAPDRNNVKPQGLVEIDLLAHSPMNTTDLNTDLNSQAPDAGSTGT